MRSRAFASSVLIFTSVLALKADTLVTSLSAFDAATFNASTITFTATCSTCFTNYSTYTDSATGTTFSLQTPDVNVTGADYYSPGVTYPADFLIESSAAFAVDNVLTVTPPAGYSAIGFNIGSFSGSTFGVTLSDGTTYDITPPSIGSLGFFGFLSPDGISSISLSIPAGDTFVIDEAVIADVVPEPSFSIPMAGILLGLAFLSRKLHKSALGAC